jgi:hypothetical protein
MLDSHSDQLAGSLTNQASFRLVPWRNDGLVYPRDMIIPFLFLSGRVWPKGPLPLTSIIKFSRDSLSLSGPGLPSCSFRSFLLETP